MFFKALKAGERKPLAGAKPGLHSSRPVRISASHRDNVTLRFTITTNRSSVFEEVFIYTPEASAG